MPQLAEKHVSCVLMAGITFPGPALPRLFDLEMEAPEDSETTEIKLLMDRGHIQGADPSSCASAGADSLWEVRDSRLAL